MCVWIGTAKSFGSHGAQCEGNCEGMHSYWSLMPGCICLTWNWSIPWWLCWIQGPPGRFLALDSLCQDASTTFRPDLQAFTQPVQCLALLCFSGPRFPPGGRGLRKTKWSPKQELSVTSHLLGLQQCLHEPQPQAPLAPRKGSFLLIHHSWHFLDSLPVLIV